MSGSVILADNKGKKTLELDPGSRNNEYNRCR